MNPRYVNAFAFSASLGLCLGGVFGASLGVAIYTGVVVVATIIIDMRGR